MRLWQYLQHLEWSHGYSIPASPFSRLKMPPRPQFDQPQRSFLAMEFHKRRGTKNFVPGLLADFAVQFPGARVPSRRAISDTCGQKVYGAGQCPVGTINNVNLATSPGVTHSGRPKTSTSYWISHHQQQYLQKLSSAKGSFFWGTLYKCM